MRFLYNIELLRCHDIFREINSKVEKDVLFQTEILTYQKPKDVYMRR